jgi:hypothetical protein
MTDRIEKARQMLREALEQYGDQFDDMIPGVQQAIMDEIEGLTREELGVAVREELKERISCPTGVGTLSSLVPSGRLGCQVRSLATTKAFVEALAADVGIAGSILIAVICRIFLLSSHEFSRRQSELR